MLAIKLVNVDEHDLCRAASLAPHFVRRHPDSIGVRNGVIFTTDGFANPLYIYRTKSQIIVRGRASNAE